MNPTAAARYAALQSARTTVLDRAREAARLTIPGIIPADGQNEHFVSEQPYQSVAAQGVASLGARLSLSLFPPNVPFFRVSLDAAVANGLGEELGEANAKLAQIGQTAHAMTEDALLRPAMTEALRHLIVAGNVLVYVRQDAPPRLYRLDQYVVKRDSTGAFKLIVVCEKVSPSALSPETRAVVGVETTSGDAEQPLEVYTVIERDGNTVSHWQEINAKEVPDSRGSSPADVCGWLPLRWLAIPGSDYGRSHVTEVIGDLLSLEELHKSMNMFAAAAGRIITVVQPSSGIDIEELANAESGDYIHGNAEYIKTLQLEKSQDWAVMANLVERYEARVSSAFLIRSNTVRNAERVTAEEIRMIAEELENALGGTFSTLSAELQLPIVRRYLYLGAAKGVIPTLPKSIRPKITTGFDALGRAAEVNRLRLFFGDLVSMLGPEAALGIVNADELARRLGVGYGVEDLAGLLKSPEQIQQEREQAMMSQAAQAAAPAMAKHMTEAMTAPEDN